MTLLFEDMIGLLLYAFCRNTILGAYNSDHLPEETFIQSLRNEWCLHNQKLRGKLKDSV